MRRFIVAVLAVLALGGCWLNDVPEPCPFTVTEDHVVHERTWVRTHPKTWGEDPDGKLVECYWRSRNDHGVAIPSDWYDR